MDISKEDKDILLEALNEYASSLISEAARRMRTNRDDYEEKINLSTKVMALHMRIVGEQPVDAMLDIMFDAEKERIEEMLRRG